jgi:hypothetical protein
VIDPRSETLRYHETLYAQHAVFERGSWLARPARYVLTLFVTGWALRPRGGLFRARAPACDGAAIGLGTTGCRSGHSAAFGWQWHDVRMAPLLRASQKGCYAIFSRRWTFARPVIDVLCRNPPGLGNA